MPTFVSLSKCQCATVNVCACVALCSCSADKEPIESLHETPNKKTIVPIFRAPQSHLHSHCRKIVINNKLLCPTTVLVCSSTSSWLRRRLKTVYEKVKGGNIDRPINTVKESETVYLSIIKSKGVGLAMTNYRLFKVSEGVWSQSQKLHGKTINTEAHDLTMWGSGAESTVTFMSEACNSPALLQNVIISVVRVWLSPLGSLHLFPSNYYILGGGTLRPEAMMPQQAMLSSDVSSIGMQ